MQIRTNIINNKYKILVKGKKYIYIFPIGIFENSNRYYNMCCRHHLLSTS